MQKKLILGVLSIVLVAALAGGFTMAWFTDSDAAEPVEFTAGTLLIDSGPIYPDPEELDYRWDVDFILPKEVVSYQQGTTAAGNNVARSRSNPNAVLTLEEGKNDRNFFSLGYYMDESKDLSTPNPDAWLGRGGEIVVKFENMIQAKDNYVVLVVEDTHGPWPEERASVYVSQNGDKWVYVGDAVNGLGVPQSYQTFSVEDKGIAWFQYVKVVDKTNPYKDDMAQDIWADWNNDAFDLNAILAQKMELARWNPGDTDEIGYYVRNLGSKRAYVRGTFNGKWYEQDETGQWVEFEGDTSLVEIEISDKSKGKWEKVANTDYYIYQGELKPREVVELYFKIHLKGKETNNDYQGKRFILKGEFEAIQTTHNAIEDQWGTEFRNVIKP